jgi:alkylresorcinol/alkylpyrone synthase
MPRIIAAATAIPPNDVPQRLAADYARRHFGAHYRDLDRLLPIFESSRIEHRQFCVPPSWFDEPKTFKEKNDAYIEWAFRLGSEAARKCLEAANASADEVDHIVFVSTTGLATPSIDARLINAMNMRRHIKRTPIWGLGCVGGAMGLSRAAEYVKSGNATKVLLVAVELCGLTFQFHDFSKSSLVATALFGDGAAAVLIAADGDGPELIDWRSTTWPDSLDVMGWTILNEGMQVVFARAIPAIVAKNTRPEVDDFISRYELKRPDLSHYLIHPGGAKVIDAYKDALCLENGELRLSEDVLRDHGNMSSVTLLYILERFLRRPAESNGSFGIMSALGPGFSAEMILFRS